MQFGLNVNWSRCFISYYVFYCYLYMSALTDSLPRSGKRELIFCYRLLVIMTFLFGEVCPFMYALKNYHFKHICGCWDHISSKKVM